MYTNTSMAYYEANIIGVAELKKIEGRRKHYHCNFLHRPLLLMSTGKQKRLSTAIIMAGNTTISKV
jgi:hypothetical protein